MECKTDGDQVTESPTVPDDDPWDVSAFKMELNSLLFVHGPGRITISEAEKAACEFVFAISELYEKADRG